MTLTWVLVKDVILTATGIAGISYMTLTGHVNNSLLLTFTAMTGIPAVTHLPGVLNGNTKSESQHSPEGSSSQDVSTQLSES
jgi:hypothetical protein